MASNFERALGHGIGAGMSTFGGMMIENSRARAAEVRRNNFARFQSDIRQEESRASDELARSRMGEQREYDEGILQQEIEREKESDAEKFNRKKELDKDRRDYQAGIKKEEREHQAGVKKEERQYQEGQPIGEEKLFNFLTNTFGEEEAKKFVSGKYVDRGETRLKREYVKSFYDEMTGAKLEGAPTYQEFKSQFLPPSPPEVDPKAQMAVDMIMVASPGKRLAMIEELRSNPRVGADIMSQIEKMVTTGPGMMQSHGGDGILQQRTSSSGGKERASKIPTWEQKKKKRDEKRAKAEAMRKRRQEEKGL